MNIKKIIVIGALLSYSLACPAPQAQVPAQRLLTLILQRKHKEAEQLCKKNIANMSQSDGHAYANLNIITNLDKKGEQQLCYYSLDLSDATTQRCFAAVYAKEVTENANGRYTFVHAQKWSFEWIASLYKTLYEATTGQVPSTYQFLRFKDPSSLQENETTLQQKLIKAEAWNNPRYLFMNASLFGNAQNSGDCSAYYFFNNQSASEPRLTASKLFRRCGLPRSLYSKYQKELEQLKQEHAKLTQRGNILLISLSPRYCQEHVIESAPSQNYQRIHATGQPVLDKLTQLKKNPTKVQKSDELVYRLILLRTKTLSPSDNIRVWSFNGIEPKKWNDFCAKRDKLFALIKKDIQQLKP